MGNFRNILDNCPSIVLYGSGERNSMIKEKIKDLFVQHMHNPTEDAIEEILQQLDFVKFGGRPAYLIEVHEFNVEQINKDSLGSFLTENYENLNYIEISEGLLVYNLDYNKSVHDLFIRVTNHPNKMEKNTDMISMFISTLEKIKQSGKSNPITELSIIARLLMFIPCFTDYSELFSPDSQKIKIQVQIYPVYNNPEDNKRKLFTIDYFCASSVDGKEDKIREINNVLSEYTKILDEQLQEFKELHNITSFNFMVD